MDETNDPFDEPAGEMGDDMFDLPAQTEEEAAGMENFLDEVEGDDPFGAEAGEDAPLDAGDDMLGAGDEVGDEQEEEAVAPDADLAEPEESPLSKFRREWADTLRQRDQEAAEKKAEVVAKAREDLQNFATQREQHKERAQATNRENEKDFLEQLEAAKDGGSSWERVVNMVDTKEDPDGLDISRMRSILIQLKAKPLKRKST